jgi:hypothetical protein
MFKRDVGAQVGFKSPFRGKCLHEAILNRKCFNFRVYGKCKW